MDDVSGTFSQTLELVASATPRSDNVLSTLDSFFVSNVAALDTVAGWYNGSVDVLPPELNWRRPSRFLHLMRYTVAVKVHVPDEDHPKAVRRGAAISGPRVDLVRILSHEPLDADRELFYPHYRNGTVLMENNARVMRGVLVFTEDLATNEDPYIIANNWGQPIVAGSMPWSDVFFDTQPEYLRLSDIHDPVLREHIPRIRAAIGNGAPRVVTFFARHPGFTAWVTVRSYRALHGMPVTYMVVMASPDSSAAETTGLVIAPLLAALGCRCSCHSPLTDRSQDHFGALRARLPTAARPARASCCEARTAVRVLLASWS